ncbi:MAG: choice-of-anchor Q domain-containing protein [Panacagrimonas sp.]
MKRLRSPSRTSGSGPSLRLTPLAIALAAGWLVIPGEAALAATIAVGGACTLGEAIANANLDNNGGGNGCAAGSGADTISLPANSTQTLTAALPNISSVITLQGNGSTVRRDPAATTAFRIFYVGQNDSLTIRDTTITGGRSSRGGGIFSYSTLSLSNSTVTGHSASGSGGGIYIGAPGALTLNNSTVSGNTASAVSGGGGGIYSVEAVTIVNSTLSNNTATGNVARGGGIFTRDGGTLTDSTVSGNSASKGGGLYSFAGSLTLTNNTVSGNSASNQGGGLFQAGGLTVTTLVRSLISGNNSPAGAEIHRSQGTMTASDSNLFGHAGLSDAQAFFGFAPGATDINATSTGAGTPLANILDSTLANNGGHTFTHALPVESPAVDAAAGTCAVTDQRGVARVQGAACDIGAVERELFVRFAQVSASVSEGIGRHQIRVLLSDPREADVIVPLVYSGAANNPGDFTGPTRVTIPANLIQADFPLNLVDDRRDEADEKITLTMRTPTNAIVGTPGQRTLTIKDNDPLPSVRFLVGNLDTAEVVKTINVKVRLSAISGRAVTVAIRYTGSATRGNDYTAPASITFKAGATEANVPVKIVNDSRREPKEIITLSLGTLTNAVSGTQTSTKVAIQAND